jgi:thioredoxin
MQTGASSQEQQQPYKGLNMKTQFSKSSVISSLIIASGIAISIYALTGKQTAAKETTVKTSLVEHLNLDSFKTNICDCGSDNGKQPRWNYKGKLPAVIDFYADWCGPCKIVSPVLEELAVEYNGRVKIYKVNTENNRELAMMFGITGIPSMLFIPAKGQPQMSSGALSKSQFKQAFSELFNVTEKL